MTTPGLTEAGRGVAFTARACAMEVVARAAEAGAMPTFRDGEAEKRDSIVPRRFWVVLDAVGPGSEIFDLVVRWPLITPTRFRPCVASEGRFHHRQAVSCVNLPHLLIHHVL